MKAKVMKVKAKWTYNNGRKNECQFDRLVSGLDVRDLEKQKAIALVVERHYLHRKPPISHAFGLYHQERLTGVITFGVPASRHLQMSVCPTDPSKVLELNRVWVCDSMPSNTESWFIARALKRLPPALVCSYADTKQSHVGYIYRATNWHYNGWTDMERKTPRYDYVVPGKHSREAFRGKNGYIRVQRKPKYRYWTATGTKRERRQLEVICGWPMLDWHTTNLDR